MIKYEIDGRLYSGSELDSAGNKLLNPPLLIMQSRVRDYLAPLEAEIDASGSDLIVAIKGNRVTVRTGDSMPEELKEKLRQRVSVLWWWTVV